MLLLGDRFLTLRRTLRVLACVRALSGHTTPGIIVTGVRADRLGSVVITASYSSGVTTSAALDRGSLQHVLTARQVIGPF